MAGSYISSTGYALDGSLKSFQYARSTALTNENVVYKFDPRSGLPVRLDEGFNQYGYVTGATYTGLGELESVRYSHNSYYTQQTNFYDDVTRRLIKSTVYAERADALLSDTRYSYDDMGNILSIGEQIRGDYQCFGYDGLRRLTQAWTPGDGDCGAAPDTAALGGPAPYWTSYEHDAVGNRVTMIDHANPLGPSTTSYSTPAAGQAQPHAVVGTTTTVGETTAEAVFEYDAAGNMITRPGQVLTWDAEGRLDTLTTDDGDVTSHVYTPDGDRLMRKNSDGSATLYLPGQEISVNTKGVLSCTRYYSFAGSAFGVRTGSTATGTQLSWLFNDHQGTASMSQFAGGDTAVFRYRDPFGNERGGPVTWPGERGFVGGTDDPSGLTHLGAREYDSALGVFISVDPVMDLTNPKQMHAYTYANGNPTTFSDPTGLYTPERGGVPCIDGDCSFHNKDGSLKNKNQCAKTGCGTNPLYSPGSKPRPGTSGANSPTGDPSKCIDGDCSFHNDDGSLKTEDECARSHCGTNSIYTGWQASGQTAGCDAICESLYWSGEASSAIGTLSEMAVALTVMTVKDMRILIEALGMNDAATVGKYAKRLAQVGIQVKPIPKLGLAVIGSKGPVQMLAKRLPYIGAGITLGSAGYDLYSNGGQYDSSKKGEVVGAAVGEIVGAAVGGAVGGAIGSSFGPLGTAVGVGVGAVVGGVLGNWAGGWIGGKIGSLW